MKKLYSYNTGTHVLHITNGCTNANGVDYLQFDSEDEAVKYAGRELGMCKTCMQKREDFLKKEFLEKKGD